MAMTYDLLLNLYRGGGQLVEGLEAEEIAEIAIKTPLIEYLRGLREHDPEEVPHIFLSGSAGDGKTFAVKAAFNDETPDGFQIFPDASDKVVGELEAELRDALDTGKKLIVLINRGRLEELQDKIKDSAHELTGIIKEARHQLNLSITKGESELQNVAVFDMGLFNLFSDRILDEVFKKVVDAQPDEDMSEQSLQAFEAAKKSLGTSKVSARIKQLFKLVQSADLRISMRQLWSMMGYLATGGRAHDSTDQPNISDSVGARLFSASGEGSLFALSTFADPGCVPQPELTKALLLENSESLFEEAEEVKALTANDPTCLCDGVGILRASWVHGATLDPFQKGKWTGKSVFEKLLTDWEMAPGTHQTPGLNKKLLRGAYRSLGLHHSDQSENFPAWQKLCYSSRKLPTAPAVATENIFPNDLVFYVPQPPELAIEVFGETWRPPHIIWAWCDEDGEPRHQLRVTPSFLSHLYSSSNERQEIRGILTSSQENDLERWLRRIANTVAETNTENVREVRVSCDGEAPITLTPDAIFDHQLEITGS